MPETTTIILKNGHHICHDSNVCLSEIKDDIITVIESIWQTQFNDYLMKNRPEDHIFLKTADVLRRIDFIEEQNLIYIRTGNIVCNKCGQSKVPEYTLKDFFYYPHAIIPHVIYKICKNCGHDQSGESF